MAISLITRLPIPVRFFLFLLPILSSYIALPVVAQSSSSACPTYPSDASCASFRLSDGDATAAVSSLCSQMSGMPGCTVSNSCTSAQATVPAANCSPMSLLADICHADMPTMSGCRSYVNMCGSAANASTSVNAQCQESTSAPLQALPTSKAATQNIYSICHEMSMTGCDTCTISSATSTYPSNNCDLLSTYSLLCKAMPDMSQCADWASMCTANPGLPYCASAIDPSSDSPPIMRMYFHTGLADYVLFESWVPRTSLQYFGTWMAIFVFGILYEGWNAFVASYEVRLLGAKSNASSSESGLVADFNNSWQERISRALFRFFSKAVSVVAAYALMLVAMTFNVGLFFAVVLGLAFGSALFTDYTRAALAAALTSSSDELCCQ